MMQRRTFMQRAALGAAAAAAASAGTRRASANETLRHAVLGVGNQGHAHAQLFHAVPECTLAAIADVDPARLARTKAAIDGGAVDTHLDFRRILDDPDIDSVSIGAPDHWHTPMALMALAAGKHVYVEKPCAHNIEEARLLAEAAEKTGLCVQHGTQSRSGEGIRQAMAALQEGVIGQIRAAKAINHQFRPEIGRAEEGEPPEGVNYDLWLGPAPEHPFTENRWHYNWHWFWDYGTGDIGNDGIHQLDVARWGLGAEFPHAVSASGGQLFYDDDHETPDTQTVVYEFDGAHLIYEMRLWTKYPIEGHDNGVVFYGDGGRLDVGREGCIVRRIGEEPETIGGGADIQAHVANFVACIRAGEPGHLNAPMAEAYPSTALSLLGNIATRVGRRLALEHEPLRCTGDDEANALFTRTYREGYGLPEV